MKAVIMILVLVMLGGAGIMGYRMYVQRQANPPKTAISHKEGDLPGLQVGAVPWGPNIENLRGRLTMLNLPALEVEGTNYHIHDHLDIYINGQAAQVPAGIGINSVAEFISPIHTHDTTGIIHVESPTVQKYTLAQFFGVWGVRFTNECIGGYCNNGERKWRLFGSGHEWLGNFSDFSLRPYQEIVLAYGTEAELPAPLPVSFAFPPDY